MNIHGGEFYAYKNIFSVRNSPNIAITVNGGTFTNEGAGDDIIWQDTSDISKMITINGGTFNSCNKIAAPNDTTIPSGTSIPKVYGIVYTSSNCPVYINGGTFNLYSDNGETLSDLGAHFVARGNGNVQINGGSFNGGNYLIISAGTGNLTNAQKAAMPADKTAEISLTTTKGASIRTKADSSGIRFQGTITQDTIDYMTNFYSGKAIYRGVVIVPEDYLVKTGGEFTFAALAEKDCNWATANASKGLIDNGDGSYTIRLAITDIKEGNLYRRFVATTYICADTDGVAGISAGDTFIYSGESSSARSAVETAQMALADVKDTNEGGYDTKVVGYYYVRNGDGTYTKTALGDGEVKYSRFNETQLGVLKSYANIVKELDDIVLDIFAIKA